MLNQNENNRYHKANYNDHFEPSIVSEIQNLYILTFRLSYHCVLTGISTSAKTTLSELPNWHFLIYPSLLSPSGGYSDDRVYCVAAHFTPCVSGARGQGQLRPAVAHRGLRAEKQANGDAARNREVIGARSHAQGGREAVGKGSISSSLSLSYVLVLPILFLFFFLGLLLFLFVSFSQSLLLSLSLTHSHSRHHLSTRCGAHARCFSWFCGLCMVVASFGMLLYCLSHFIPR